MAFDDVERTLQKRLREQEVKPREAAWEAIETRLGPEPLRRGRPAWLLPVAAAATLALMIGSLWFLSTPEAMPVGEPVVDTPARPALSPSASAPGVEIPQQDRPDGENQPREPVEATLIGVAPVEPEGDGLESNWAAAGEGPFLQAGDTAGLSDLIAQHLDSVFTQVTIMEEGRGAVTDTEIDSLLRQAQLAIARQSRQDTVPGVDAMALLSEAEQELDRSFREQILEKLRSGFRKVRTAVADRNQ
jgi:hypothetical protein